MSMIDGGNAFSDFNEAPGVGTYSPATRTVLEVFQQVKRSFGDESNVQLEDADILRWINDAQDEIVKRNRILKATSTVTSIINQRSYMFPTEDIMQIESLHYGGSILPNVPFAQAELEIIASPNAADTGAPQLWYEWGGRFSLFPTPDTEQPITLYYTMRPNRVTLSTDVLGVPDKYYQDVIRYVLKEAYEMDEDPSMSQLKEQQFDRSLEFMAEEDRTAQNMTYSTITIIEDGYY